MPDVRDMKVARAMWDRFSAHCIAVPGPPPHPDSPPAHPPLSPRLPRFRSLVMPQSTRVFFTSCPLAYSSLLLSRHVFVPSPDPTPQLELFNGPIPVAPDGAPRKMGQAKTRGKVNVIG